MHIKKLVEEAHRIAIQKGWWDPYDRNVGELLLLCVCELSEAMEEFREGYPLDMVYYTDKNPTKPEGFPIELADVILRLADLCGRYNIDIEKAIVTKLAYNTTRTKRHGNKLA